MKIIFFGLGSIGKKHAKILANNFSHELFAYRSKPSKIVNKLGIKEIYTWQQIKQIKPDIAFITNPTFLHIKTAIKCARLGMHLFIEKPLSHNLKSLDLLESICRKKKLVCYIAYCLRFHPVIKKLKKLIKGKKIYHVRVVCSSHLKEWIKDDSLDNNYRIRAKKGGGVLLELSHEFDYIQYLFSEIKNIRGKCERVGDLTVDVEDFADIILDLNDDILVNMHLNFNSYIKERTIKIDFNNGYLIGDLFANKIDYLYDNKRKVFKFKVNASRYLKDQSKYFFSNIDNPSMINNIKEAKAILQKILEIKNEK